jgi:fructose-specific phosphotransferase system component IIB
MSKKIISILVIALLFSCSSTKSIANKSLYEVLLVSNDGGANIKFYEIFTESKEIKMLLGDESLRKKIDPNDITRANFVILNAGPTEEKSNKVTIENVIETPTQIEVYIKDNQKNIEAVQTNDETLYPYTVIKINSKKPIVIK